MLKDPSPIDILALHRYQQKMLAGYAVEASLGEPVEFPIGFKIAWTHAAFDRLRVQYRRLIAMTPQERIVLLSLWEGGPQTITDLAKATALSMSAISQLVDRLVERGQLERTEDPADRRRKMVSVSPLAYVPLDPLMFLSNLRVSERFLEWPKEKIEVFLEGMNMCHDVMTEVTETLSSLDDNALRALSAEMADELREMYETGGKQDKEAAHA